MSSLVKLSSDIYIFIFKRPCLSQLSVGSLSALNLFSQLHHRSGLLRVTTTNSIVPPKESELTFNTAPRSLDYESSSSIWGSFDSFDPLLTGSILKSNYHKSLTSNLNQITNILRNGCYIINLLSNPKMGSQFNSRSTSPWQLVHYFWCNPKQHNNNHHSFKQKSLLVASKKFYQIHQFVRHRRGLIVKKVGRGQYTSRRRSQSPDKHSFHIRKV